MSIVGDEPDDFVGLEDHQPTCTCRPEYAYRKNGTRIDRHRIDPFCEIHGYHYRREIASAYCRSFNKRRHFSNFIVHLGPRDNPALESWAKRHVTALVRKHFDKNAIIKMVMHPKDGDRHLHVGVGSDVGHVTLAAILNAKSTRGRKPRLDLNAAWVDGYLRDRRWNWCSYTLRVEEGWRDDEWVNRRQRRSWRSRADKGERIKAPTFSGKDEWYGTDDVVVEDVELLDVKEAATVEQAKATSRNAGLGRCLVPFLRWKARKWLECWKKAISVSSQRISTFVGGITQDGRKGEPVPASPPCPQARPPPASARSPPEALPNVARSRTRCPRSLENHGVFQSRTVPSSEAVAMMPPFTLVAMAVMGFVCPCKVANSVWFFSSQTRSVRSSATVAAC